MTASALAFALLPRVLGSIYTTDAAVIELAAALLPIAALFQIFDGTQAVGSGILRGAADTRAAAVINLVGYWLIGLPVGLILAFSPPRAGGGGDGAALCARLRCWPAGLWWGLTLGLMVVAVLLVLRVARRLGRGAAGR
jgi:MATE family multidrug resistance protein